MDIVIRTAAIAFAIIACGLYLTRELTHDVATKAADYAESVRIDAERVIATRNAYYDRRVAHAIQEAQAEIEDAREMQEARKRFYQSR